jgi:diacylglycerol kinase (CTP)
MASKTQRHEPSPSSAGDADPTSTRHHLAPEHAACLRPHLPEATTTISPPPDHHAVGVASSAASSNANALDPPDQHQHSHHGGPSSFSLFRSPSPSRASRRDRHHQQQQQQHSFPPLWPSAFHSLRRIIAGAVRCPVLPPFAYAAMSLRQKTAVPSTPRVISPSPTPSEHDGPDYHAPVTRSAARKRGSAIGDIAEEDTDAKPGFRQSRTRSRSPVDSQRVSALTSRRLSQTAKAVESNSSSPKPASNGKSATNGHLAPPQTGWSWRDFSRSPSPLGLIPIHRHWRTFVHKHEVPRKILHVSIGFFVIWLYVAGAQTSSVAPYLMAALIPIAATDWLRHRYASFNRFYVKVLGALMRETEYAGWNGVIFYLLGAWIVLHFFPKDVGVVSVLLLSWCDTAASTFGRLWGRYTPRIRRGKSLAGSLAAFVVGVATSWFFYGWLVPKIGPMPGDENFMFQGTLSLPQAMRDATGLTLKQASITGPLALGVMSLWSGFVASASEVVDLFGWDDNLTIPVLSGIGIWGFLKSFALS